MSGLERRVDAVEARRSKGKRFFLWVTYAAGGGLVYDGRFYADAVALFRALGIEPDEDAIAVGWGAAELLA